MFLSSILQLTDPWNERQRRPAGLVVRLVDQRPRLVEVPGFLEDTLNDGVDAGDETHCVLGSKSTR